MSGSSAVAIQAKWKPREWTAFHESIVIRSMLGKSNTEIATEIGYTPQHVSNILNSPEASMARRRVLEVLRTGVASSIDERLSDLADKAVVRLSQVMNDDELFEKSPFAVVDRGLSILRGVGRLKTQSDINAANQTNIKSAIFMSPGDAELLRLGIQKADEAQRLHGPIKTEVEVVPEAAD